MEAGVPTATDLPRAIIERLDAKSSDKNVANAIKFVAGGLFFREGIQGINPYQGINVEDLVSAVQMLAKRSKLEIAPFIGQWHPTIEALERYRPGSQELSNLERALEATLARYGGANPELIFGGNFVREFSAMIGQLTHPSAGELFEEASKVLFSLLTSFVWIEDPERVGYLAPLVNLGRDALITIATLNYDNSIELAGTAQNVSVNIGFDEWSRDGIIPSPEFGVELLKLHGSINWMFSEERWTYSSLPYDSLDEVPPGRVTRGGYTPAIIFGGGNKLTARGPFLDLFQRFRLRLQHSEKLLVIGYSGRDEHINEVLGRWLNSDVTRRLWAVLGPRGRIQPDSFWALCERHLRERCVFLSVGAGDAIRDIVGEVFQKQQQGPRDE